MSDATYHIDQDDMMAITFMPGCSIVYRADTVTIRLVSGSQLGLASENANYLLDNDQLPPEGGYSIQEIQVKHPLTGSAGGTIYFRPRDGSVTIEVTNN